MFSSYRHIHCSLRPLLSCQTSNVFLPRSLVLFVHILFLLSFPPTSGLTSSPSPSSQSPLLSWRCYSSPSWIRALCIIFIANNGLCRRYLRVLGFQKSLLFGRILGRELCISMGMGRMRNMGILREKIFGYESKF
ncbi:hypothetical protein C8R42DRAFT_370110 [Lentinula raphanica]|nr:hypothetical protein C8R42DRAFT_370110 [Lentinula raphanica]